MHQELFGRCGQACIHAAEPCSSSNAGYFADDDADTAPASGRVRVWGQESIQPAMSTSNLCSAIYKVVMLDVTIQTRTTALYSTLAIFI